MAEWRERIQDRLQHGMTGHGSAMKSSEGKDSDESHTGESRGENLVNIMERQATRVSSPVVMNLAAASLVASIAVAVFGRRKEFASFVGLWAPTLLLVGVYNKLLRMEHVEDWSERRRSA